MNENDSDRSMDAIVNRVADAFESQTISPRPPDNTTLEWIARNSEPHSGPSSATPFLNRPRNRMMQLIVRSGAVAAVIAFAIPFWLGGKTAFAQIKKQLNEVRTVKFLITIERTGQPALSGEAVAIRPQLLRIDWGVEGKKSVNVTDYKNGELISYADDSLVTIHKIEKSQTFDPIKELLELRDNDAHQLAQSENKIAETLLFEIKKDGATGRLWASEKTRLPVRVELQTHRDLGGGQVVCSDFEWNIEVNENKFKVPEGREIVRDDLLAAPKEEELIAAFRLRHAFTDEAFPTGFWNDKVGIGSLAYDRNLSREENYQRQMKVLEPILSSIGLTQAAAANPKELQRRIDFLDMRLGQWQHTVKEYGGWVGDGVRHGEDKPLCWWRFRNKKIRVLFADLTIRDAEKPPQE